MTGQRFVAGRLHRTVAAAGRLSVIMRVAAHGRPGMPERGAGRRAGCRSSFALPLQQGTHEDFAFFARRA
ncbi:hypothetical protein, partial [Cupriavidus sp. HPC(L)]|uniref:hypothetical protein n=1 Tax=Cupriavidus sp. HPC(L) TaxID=1217418 RepID=UPI001C10FCC9